MRPFVNATVQNRFRPRLEAMEAREVPAIFTWVGNGQMAPVGVFGGDPTSAANPYNWAAAFASGPFDSETPHGLPWAGDSVRISPSTYDCVGLTVYGGGAFHELTVGGTGGTVVFGASIATELFALSGAAISQPTTGRDLTVTESFTWTGGTLNSSTNLANVTLNGATGLISPGGSNAVTTGSTLNFAGGSQTTVEGGTISLSNSATLYVDDTSGVCIDTSAANVNFTAQPGAQPAPIKFDGAWTVDGGKDNSLPTGVQLTGSIKVQGNATLTVNSGTALSIETLNNKGKVVIQNDSTVKVSTGLKMSAGGEIQTVTLNLPNVTDQRNKPAIIDGDFHLAGGTLTLGVGSNPHIWSKLKVTGLGDWSGGIINLTVDPTAANNRFDSLEFGKSFISTVQLQGGNPVANAPKLVLSLGALPPLGNQVWKPVITSAVEIVNNGPLPSVTASAGMGFTIVPANMQNNKFREWQIQN